MTKNMTGGHDLLPGFTGISEQVFIRRPTKVQSHTEEKYPKQDQPEAVLIFGWGDASPKSLCKYAEGYKAMYPNATQVIALAPIAKMVCMSLGERTQAMAPVISAIFPQAYDKHQHDGDDQMGPILIHAMSGTGAINYAAALNAYRERYGEPLPHRLLVLDSMPGNPVLNLRNLRLWSRAMAIGTAKKLALPFRVTRGICALFLCGNWFANWIRGVEPAGIFTVAALIDTEYQITTARQLYLYSRTDDIVPHEDIEAHAVKATQRGYTVSLKTFVGSGHVRHMQIFPEEYWGAIRRSWECAGGLEERELKANI